MIVDGWVSFLDHQKKVLGQMPESQFVVWLMIDIWHSGHETDVPCLSPKVLSIF